jgi:hypothetical protein
MAANQHYQTLLNALSSGKTVDGWLPGLRDLDVFRRDVGQFAMPKDGQKEGQTG